MDTTEEPPDPRAAGAGPVEAHPALVLVWCADDPSRVGEVALPAALPSPHGWVLGRGDRPPPRGKRLGLVRQRPGINEPRPALEAASVSREQLGLRWDGQRLLGERLGSATMERNGAAYVDGPLEVGDVLSVGRHWLWLIELRPAVLPALRVDVPPFSFGQPDAWGLVGESPALWALRERVATVGPLAMHVLLQGPSGVGKELVARGLHAASPRRSRPFIARNAATLPSGLVDAELFGNVRGYPNPTMVERPGLVGAADSGTLFLDELGELPHEAQAHLLRVLDDGGEYQRLGEAQTRRSDLRLIGATNRAPTSLKHDLLQRFRLRVDVPGLDTRGSDIPHIILHLIELLRQRSPTLHDRGLVRRGGREVLALDLGFVARLVARRQWTGHVRELDTEVWQAFLDSHGGPIGLGFGLTNTSAESDETTSLDRSGPIQRGHETGRAVGEVVNEDPGPDAIAEALKRAGGNISGAARELGLSSRYALYRLMQRHRLDARESRG